VRFRSEPATTIRGSIAPVVTPLNAPVAALAQQG